MRLTHMLSSLLLLRLLVQQQQQQQVQSLCLQPQLQCQAAVVLPLPCWQCPQLWLLNLCLAHQPLLSRRESKM